ncbi:MAG TPA: hypothetical protein VN855_00255 [Candidatus Acidoferrum sp.]|nr:hypothetical protein [Candidatus Acidoferrum sp.]
MREKISELIDVLMGFRKFIAWSLLLLVGIVFRIKGLVDGGQFVDMMKTVTISFFGANSVEHFSSMVKAHLEAKMATSNGNTQKDTDNA